MTTVFLWGQRFPEPAPDQGGADGDWWRQYSERLSVSAETRAELADSSRRLMSLLPPPGGKEGLPSPVRGAVVGSVQSGKTAHMLAVTARALDAGYKCVVILAGLKDDLRAQTARRLNVQLLRQRDPLAAQRAGFTMSLKESERRVTALAPPYFVDCHQWHLFHIKMNQALDQGIPVVAVIKKNGASLSSMRQRIHQGWSRLSPKGLPLLVLDDECDEASVEPDDETPTPELIANLWRPAGGAEGGTVAYVGYTATVAANLLQRPDNALYPSDFVYLLRSPAARETRLTFREPTPHRWYCGGEVFYERFIRPVDGGSSLLVEPSITSLDLSQPPAANASLKQAIRTFLVGAALRHLEHPERSLDNPRCHAAPHTMIVQPSTAILDHEKWARAIRSFLGVDDAEGGASRAALESDHLGNPAKWTEALASLEQSRTAVSELQPHPWPLRLFVWDVVWDAILRAAPFLRVRVLNSAPGSVDALDFEPATDSSGQALLPRDLLSIVVGGGRLSRGLTIEGLSVSYFSRGTDVPAEDTILQLSRWYGYRGAHLDFCRVFTTDAMAGDLVWIHEHDQELRTRLASLMESHTTPRQAGIVLSSIPHGLPTAKLGVGKLRDVSYSPWCRALNFVETGDWAEHNESVSLALVKQIAERGGASVRTETGAVRGMLSQGWSADEVVRELENLQFTRHNPDHEIAMLSTAYKPRQAGRPAQSCLPEEVDPYAIAAYLRLWVASAKKDGSAVPAFNVGVAYGGEEAGAAPFAIPLANREISPEGFVNGGWIGRSESWAGDQFFDGISADLLIDDTAKRREGAPGLLLLYVIHKDGQGRRGRGIKRTNHSPMLGISIPRGGPSFRRVRLESEGGA